MSRAKEKTRKKGKLMWGLLYLLAFVIAFGAGAASKTAGSSMGSAYEMRWDDSLGIIQTDLPYGEGPANKFDLYLPADSTKETYGLAVYLHAGGFTSGDKADDQNMLSWLCAKGYVAAGINYTLRTEENTASVLTQSNEIKAAIPQVVAAAEEAGYPIDKMTIAGGSAGHALAMIYAYRDGAEAPVPVVLTFGAVGPSSFYQEDWGIFGLDQSDDACAGLFSVMAGVEITPEEVADGSYDHEGDTMPEGFSTRLPADNPGVLGHSLADELPSELTHIEHIPITDPNADSALYYDSEKPFTLNIFDDGPTQAAGSHRATSGAGIIDDSPFLEEMFSRSLAQTELLMPEKLLLMLERYQGNSIQLPAHEGVDDTVYGSLAVYRQEVIEELGQWADNHSLPELDAAMGEAIANTEESGGYLAAWEEIRASLK